MQEMLSLALSRVQEMDSQISKFVRPRGRGGGAGEGGRGRVKARVQGVVGFQSAKN